MLTPLRPLTTAELLDTTFSLYRRHFLLFVGLVAVPYLFLLPLQILSIVVSGQRAGSILPTLMVSLAIVVMTLAVTAASQGATFIAVSEVYLDRPSSVIGALARIRGETVGLAALMIVIGIGTGIGLLLLVVPGVYIALRWSLAIPVAVLEHETIGGALSRSSDLTQGSRLRILLVWVLFFVLTVAISLLLGIPTGIVSALARAGGVAPLPGWVQILNVVASFVASCLAGPFLTIAIAVLYYDMRVRKEALDLQLMMSALDGGAAAAAGTQIRP